MDGLSSRRTTPALTGPLGLTTVLDPSPAGPPAAGTIDLSTVRPTEAAIGELAETWNGPDRTGDLGRIRPDGCLE